LPDQGDTEILQILGRQAREHVFVDLAIAERLVVTLKTKAAQPYRYVHAVILGSEERQPLMKEHIPLPFGRPTVLNSAVVGVADFTAVNDCFRAWALYSGQIGNAAFP
jgi:hypothetical protein